MSVYAQEYGYFFNSNNSDRKYSAASFETWLKPFFVSGVFTGGLQVQAQTTPDMTVTVSAGYANLDGKLGFFPSANTLTLSAASGVYSRIDTIVLRRDNTNRRISMEVVTGVASASPSPTAPTRTADIYELVLAQILVGVGVTSITNSNITDKRIDTTVCGYVCAAVETPDFSELYTQYTAQFQEWFDHMKDQLDEDAAGHLQLEIDDITEQMGTVPEGSNLQDEITALGTELAGAEAGMAIVVNGDTAPKGISSGQYLFIKNHSTLATGGYHATAAIASGATISSSNVAADADGIANALSAQIANIDTQMSTKQNAYSFSAGSSGGTFSVAKGAASLTFIMCMYRASGTDARDGFMIVKVYNSVAYVVTQTGATVVTSVSYNSTNSTLDITVSAYATIIVL